MRDITKILSAIGNKDLLSDEMIREAESVVHRYILQAIQQKSVEDEVPDESKIFLSKLFQEDEQELFSLETAELKNPFKNLKMVAQLFQRVCFKICSDYKIGVVFHKKRQELEFHQAMQWPEHGFVDLAHVWPSIEVDLLSKIKDYFTKDTGVYLLKSKIPGGMGVQTLCLTVLLL